MTYVNFLGEEIALIDHGTNKKVKKAQRDSYHNGWRVQGIPPEAVESAREGNRRLQEMANKAGGKPIPSFDLERWLMTAKGKPVRSRPFEVPQAAQECKELAERMGWLRVEVVELKKGSL